MLQYNLHVLLTSLILSLSTIATAAFTCSAKYFLKSASTNKYYTVDEVSSYIDAVGTHRGWYQQFTLCRDSSWAPQFFVLKSEAYSSKLGEDCYVKKVGNDWFAAEPGPLTGNYLLEWGRSGEYWGLVHAETGGYLTSYGGVVYLGPTNLGWDQALWREE
ncbi:hypothetical protein QBC34DRAFT_387323 [Podospora aff. communis PSN243]|uniref:Ecp2 effector protein domain-containing protein n=1 Tax=Podospora aff. communis PSN243 TaxID=3040156 RepID=A0AAV9G5C9_9PEZI|nr:hypothetical protein QBC34DRAFT_387323 [Podospora aff. communis PSN243]